MADITNKNPWLVNNLKDFQFYVCPECDVKEKFLETFLQHALNEHDKAKETLPKIIVKAEFEDEENYQGVEIENSYLRRLLQIFKLPTKDLEPADKFKKAEYEFGSLGCQKVNFMYWAKSPFFCRKSAIFLD